MGQTGYLRFFCQHEIKNARDVFTRAIELAGSDTIGFAVRTEMPYTQWSDFRHYIETGEQIEDPPDEFVAEKARVSEVAQYFMSGGTLSVHFNDCPLGQRVEAATKRDIPESIRGTFNIGAPIVTLGWREIFECVENEEGHFFGRSFLTFTLMGWSTPNDWKEYRRLVFEIPEIKQLKADIEKIVGPVEQCIYWDV